MSPISHLLLSTIVVDRPMTGGINSTQLREGLRLKGRLWCLRLRRVTLDPRPFLLFSSICLFFWGLGLAYGSGPELDGAHRLFRQLPGPILAHGWAAMAAAALSLYASADPCKRRFLVASIVNLFTWFWSAYVYLSAFGWSTALVYLPLAGFNAWTIYRYFRIGFNLADTLADEEEIECGRSD